jgi:phosphoribosyl-ATP pyrophosphohydrolase
VYHSRRRGVWIKGETSGDTQELLRIDLDCDRDALRFVVRQRGDGFCHLKTDTCWGNHAGLAALERTIRQRLADAPAGSYTRRLLDDPALLRAKLMEEAGELATALDPSKLDARGTRSAAANEAADLLYFALVALAKADASLADVGTILDARSRKVTRRPGNAKPSH